MADRATRSVKNRSEGQDPEAMLESMYRGQMDVFRNYYDPLIRSLEDEAESTKIVDAAKKDAARLNDVSIGMTERTIGRSGQHLTPSQKRAVERNRKSVVSIGESTVLNNGRRNQERYRESVINDLMATSAALQTGSIDALTQITANKQRRDQAYENANSGFMSNVLGTVGAIGGFAVGGPTGAAVGGAIGTTAGGYV